MQGFPTDVDRNSEAERQMYPDSIEVNACVDFAQLPSSPSRWRCRSWT